VPPPQACSTCWIDRGDHAWPETLAPADLRVTTLIERSPTRLDAHLHPDATLRKEQAA
jgi:hypothetical protein